MRQNVFRVLITVLAVSACFLIGATVYLLRPFPTPDSILERNLSIAQGNPSLMERHPSSYHVPREASFEVQGHNQCSAFSTACLLRSLGKDVKGAEVYREINFKIPLSGYVLPKGIMTYLEQEGLHPSIFQGTIDTLKERIRLGYPVIVLVGNGLLWQHYMTILGYDDEKGELYFFDSKKETDENGSMPGNRTLQEDYFLSLWDNGLPWFHHMYIIAAS
ncbi:C39 family peptidase [Heliobacterium chlorum]|uniref:C39 family peptidase n=1 Tax=Heliobacterium chlorum TaxID=2698 RepID=A0ABR7T232_HELCL|nr:C39 family peptidase [Heliobacterium chlorum]